MRLTISIIALSITAISIFVVALPRTPLQFIHHWHNARATQLRILASVFRIALGAVLILGAYATDFPATVRAIGWIALFAGVVFLFVGSTNFEKMVSWALGWLTPALVRAAGMLGAALGTFLLVAST